MAGRTGSTTNNYISQHLEDIRWYNNVSSSNNFNLSEHFSLYEFQCNCGSCSRTPVNPKLIALLECVRDEFCKDPKEYIKIFGYRCPTCNASLSNASSTSYHMTGRAADFSIWSEKGEDYYQSGNKVNYAKIAAYLEDLGATGIGLYDSGYIHVDTRPGSEKCYYKNDSWTPVGGSFGGSFGSKNQVLLNRAGRFLYSLPVSNTAGNGSTGGSGGSTGGSGGSTGGGGSSTGGGGSSTGNNSTSNNTSSNTSQGQPSTAPTVPVITRRTGLKYSDELPPYYCEQTMSLDYQNKTQMEVKGILWHSTGANNPWLKRYVQPDDDAEDRDEWLELLGVNEYGTDWNHTVNDARLNAFIGKLADGTVATVQTTEWTRKPGGCYYGSNGSCNNGWIQFEICEDTTDDKEYFDQVYEEACQLTAYLCRKFNLDPHGTVFFNNKVQVPVILDHALSYELKLGSNHGDVTHWLSKFGKSLATIRNEVKAILDAPTDGRGPFPEVNVGQVVTLADNATAFDGHPALGWMLNKRWVVTESDPNNEWALLGNCKDHDELVLNKYFSKHDLTIVEVEDSEENSSAPPPNIGSLDPMVYLWYKLRDGITVGPTTYEGIGTDNGVAALMGNIKHESGYSYIKIQGNYNIQTDQEYVASIDRCADFDSAYALFVDGPDQIADSSDDGFGLIQWDWPARKKGLLTFVRNDGVSIGDRDHQIAYVLQELRSGYSALLEKLRDPSTSIEDATLAVLMDFENPSTKNDPDEQQKRISSAYDAYSYCGGKCPHATTTVVDECNPSCTCDGYSGDVVCSSCGEIVQYGVIRPALGHTLDQHNGVCTSCGYVDWTYTPEEVVSRNDIHKLLDILYPILNR